MKSRLEIILEKLPNQEVELSAHKIELGLIDDFKSVSSNAIKSGTNSGGDLQDWLKKLPKLISNLKNSLKDQDEVIKIGDKIKKQAKEIGVDLPKSVEKDIKGAEQWSKELDSIIKKANSIKF